MLKRVRPNMQWALTQLSHAQLHKGPQEIIIVMHVLVRHKTGFPTLYCNDKTITDKRYLDTVKR
jgi:hypothetical protein